MSDLTLVDLEGMALRYNPGLAEAAARVDATEGQWIQVGLPPNPALGYSGQQLGSHGSAEQPGVYVGQEFITAKKLRLNRESAAWEIDRAQQELEATRLRVLTDVRIGFYDVLIAQRRRELASKLVHISEQGQKAAEALFQGQEVSKADPLRARVETESARILLQNTINQHTQAWRQLIAIIGIPKMQIQHLTGDLQFDDLEMSWQEELHRLLSQSPEIAVAVAEAEAARWDIERAYAEVVPNIEVEAVFQEDNGTGSNNSNLQVSMPLPIWNRNQGGIQRAQANAMAAERAVDRVALQLQTRLAAAFQQYQSARNQVHQYSKKDGIIDHANQTLNL
ncbi:MAG: TolC family protein, partial [Planctomycetales bacterium]